MKLLMKYGLLLLISITLIACGSDDDNNTNNNTPTGAEFIVDIDNESYEPDIVTSQMTNEGRFVLISGLKGAGGPNGSAIGVSIGNIFSSGDAITTGNYSSSNDMASFIFTPGEEESFEASSAQIVVTAIDTNEKTITGTFQGTLSRTVNGVNETIEFTNGEFNNVSYTEI